MKRTISSVLALAMVAALLAIFAGAASAQADPGKAHLTAVNGIIGSTVAVTAVDANGASYDLGTGLGDAGVGAPVVVEPGDYTITFNDGTSDVASYQLSVGPVEAWNIVSGYADPGDANANNARAYPILLSESTPAVVFANSSAVDVTVTPGDVPVGQGAQSAAQPPSDFTISTPSGASVDAPLAGVAATSHTDVIAVGDDTVIQQATLTIPDLAALKASLEPAPVGVAVPDVVGQTEADATSAITGAGLVAAPTAVPDDTVPVGTVISQTPAAGDMVDAGSTVNIDVSAGPTTVPVPDVAGKTAADAQAELEGAGFTVVTEEQSSMDVEAGLVVETNPSAGTEVAAGTEVKMIVSSGAGEIIVPNFAGMTTDEATTAADDAGLTITFVEDADNPDPEGVVVSQDPAGGTTVEAGTEVVAQLSPAVDDAWVILTLSPERVLNVSGINFQPGSTVDLSVLNTDKGAKATVQDDGSWSETADLSDVQNEAELLLVTGTAADGNAYEATFKIPAAGDSTDEVTVEEESSNTPLWVWIALGILVIAAIALGYKMFVKDGSDDADSTGGDECPGRTRRRRTPSALKAVRRARRRTRQAG